MIKRLRGFSSERAQKLNRAGDAVLLGLASVAASFSRGTFQWNIAITLLVTGGVLWLLASRAVHQYVVTNGRGFRGDLALTLVMIAAVVVPISLSSVAFPHHVPAAHVSRFIFLWTPAVLALRLRVVGPRLLRAHPVTDVLIAGVGPLGRLTGAEIDDGDEHRLLGYLRFDDEAPDPRRIAPLLGAVSDLETTLRERVVDEVYIASTSSAHSHEVQDAIRTCERLGVPFALPACPYRLTRARPASGSAIPDGYVHFTAVHVSPLALAAKRVFDIVVSATAIVLLSPVLAAAAVLVKLTSPGPMLFRQTRVGLLGREFQMLKFRSMVVNAEELKAKLMAQNEQSGPVFKMENDPRITPVGRFLRKYSIDELPQLINVLRGDMSIVGPRPPLPSEVARYEAWQRRRLSVRPGITCVWQVSGRSDIAFQDWMLLDMQYIDHWSFAGDFVLILKTIPAVLTGRGAR